MSDVSDDSQFFTLAEFSKVAGLSLSTIRRRIADGTLPAWQPGGMRTSVRIPRAAINVVLSRTTSVSSDKSQLKNSVPTARAPRSRPRWQRNA